ncbi:MAG: ParB N-terminal domain-containing protein [Roseomonas sp.]|nr:ParB N-terminal domain-containing protein [Roseomonas sp.]
MDTDIVSLGLDDIVVGARVRRLNGAWVDLIAASMRERGQDTPITVGPADEDGRHALIAGAHRLAAARQAGLQRISAMVRAETGAAADLLEIDENLLRHELTQLDRSVFLARRQQIWERLYPDTAHGKARKGAAGQKTTGLSFMPETFTAATARSLGLDQRSIQRAIARARIAEDVREMIAHHPIANSGAQLDQLVALPVAEQRRVAQALARADNPARNIAAALAESRADTAPPPANDARQIYISLVSAWEKAGKKGDAGREARKLFHEYLKGLEPDDIRMAANPAFPPPGRGAASRKEA